MAAAHRCSEEKFCRFCHAELPDWRLHLLPDGIDRHTLVRILMRAGGATAAAPAASGKGPAGSALGVDAASQEATRGVISSGCGTTAGAGHGSGSSGAASGNRPAPAVAAAAASSASNDAAFGPRWYDIAGRTASVGQQAAGTPSPEGMQTPPFAPDTRDIGHTAPGDSSQRAQQHGGTASPQQPAEEQQQSPRPYMRITYRGRSYKVS